MPARVHVRFGELGGVRLPGGRPRLARLVRRAVRAALDAKRVAGAEITVALLGDAGIADLNRRYLGHDGPTDVLAFPLFGPGEPVLGDVCIGLAQTMRQAAALDVPLAEEIARLAVHGTLHVLGLDHPEGPGRKASAMWRLQERIVAQLGNAD
jgi:probable rRNA maturation factor